MRQEKVAGAIFPVPKKLANRLFDGKTKSFVKCMTHNVTRLTANNKIVFYESHGDKMLVGEATIEKVEFLNPDSIVSLYGNDLFLNENEFRQYVGCRKTILVLSLKGIKKYDVPIKSKRNITMAGQYITKNEYFSILKETGKK